MKILEIGDVELILEILRENGRREEEEVGHDWSRTIYTFEDEKGEYYEVVVEEEGICENCARLAGYKCISEAPTTTRITIYNKETGERKVIEKVWV